MRLSTKFLRGVQDFFFKTPHPPLFFYNHFISTLQDFFQNQLEQIKILTESKHFILDATNESNYDTNQNYRCVVGFSRNILTVLSIKCEGQSCKCRIFTPLIGIDVRIYINICRDGGMICKFFMGRCYHQSDCLVIFQIPELFLT